MSDAERWTIRNVPVKYKKATGEDADGELVIISGPHPPLGEEVKVVPASELEHVEAERDRLVEALGFYANPETYFAIGFLPDAPTGEFMDDFEDTRVLGYKPGKRAREALASLHDEGTRCATGV